MAILKILVVFFLISCVSADSLLKRRCLNGSKLEAHRCSVLMIQDLLQDYSAGILDLGIKPIDPIYLDEIEVIEENLDMKFSYPNFKVTGFKNVIVEDIIESNETDAVTYSMSFSMVAEGPIKVEFLKKKKVIVGRVKFEGETSASIILTYTSKTVHTPSSVKTLHEAGPEQISCQATAANSILSYKLRQAFESDPDVLAVKDQYYANRKEHQKKVVCEIATAVYKVAMSNIRAYSRIDHRT